jgi:hypothetical protein
MTPESARTGKKERHVDENASTEENGGQTPRLDIPGTAGGGRHSGRGRLQQRRLVQRGHGEQQQRRRQHAWHQRVCYGAFVSSFNLFGIGQLAARDAVLGMAQAGLVVMGRMDLVTDADQPAAVGTVEERVEVVGDAAGRYRRSARRSPARD